MKKLLYIFLTCFAFILQAGSIEESQAIYELICDGIVDVTKKHEVALTIYENPGNYDPRALAAAALVFIQEKEFEKMAVLIVAARCRLDIDCRLAQGRYNEELVEKWKDQIELIELGIFWNNWDPLNFVEVSQQFVEWDDVTPREYDFNWVNWDPEAKKFVKEPIEIDQDEKNRIIVDYYRRKQQEFITEDPDFVKETGCSFNEESHIYTDLQHGFRFIIPMGYQPRLSLENHLEIENSTLDEVIYVQILNREDFLNGASIEEFYQWVISTNDEGKIQKHILPNGFEVIEMRGIKNPSDRPHKRVSNFFIFHEKNIYLIQLLGEEKGNGFESILQTFDF